MTLTFRRNGAAGPAAERRRTAAIVVLALLGMNLMGLDLPGIGLLGLSQANSWASSVSTNSTSWSIHRQSQNMTFEYNQSVQGTVSPVEYRGRSISPSVSSYQDLRANDVRLRSRTAALLGNYSSEERLSLQAYTPEAIFVTVKKESGSPLIKVDYSEQWPVIFKFARLIEYEGEQINDREFSGNNQDYAGSSFLYNTRLTRESNVGMILRRMNATVLGVNRTVKMPDREEILTSAEFKPSREMMYRLYARSTGTAELVHHLASSGYDFVPGTYPAIFEGEERYTGNYTIVRSLYTLSDYRKINETEEDEDWYPCCFTGHDSIDIRYRMGLERSVEDVFDSTSYQGG